MEQEQALPPQQDERLEILVDPHPTSIQFIAFSGFLVGLIGGYIGLSAVFALGSCSLIGVMGGLLIGTGISLVLERLLKANWKSNRYVHAEADRIAFVFGGQQERAINPRETVTPLMWRFEITRRSRVPKGWHVAAIALEQDDLYLPVYTLMPPEAMESFDVRSLFSELTGSRREMKVDGEDMRLAGKQRRLLTAETARNLDGVEMTNEDFEQFVVYLQRQFPAWMPQNSIRAPRV